MSVFRFQVDYFVGIGKGFKSGACMAGLASRLPRTFLMWCSTTCQIRGRRQIAVFGRRTHERCLDSCEDLLCRVHVGK